MNEICPTCNGSGAVDVFIDALGEPAPVTCPDCGGSGESDADREYLAEAREWYYNLEDEE